MTTCSIDSGLHSLKILIDTIHEFTKVNSELLKHDYEPLKIVKLEPKVVRTFLLCARRFSTYGWEDHSRLEPFLSELQGVVIYHAEAFYLSTHPELSCFNDLRILTQDFRKKFSSFSGDISTMYCSFREISTMFCSLQDFVSVSPSSLYALMDEDLVEFIDSLLDNLVEIGWYDSYLGPFQCPQSLQVLQEKLKFLKDFILFARLQGVESSLLKDSIFCLQHLPVEAAYLSYRCRLDEYFDVVESHSFSLMISEVHQLYDSCIQCLMAASKFSGSLQTLNPEKDMSAVGDFADSLTGILWEVLNHERGFAVAKQNQIQMLYVGLRFLRTILKTQPELFNGLLHQKMKVFIRSVVNEVGILVLECSRSVNAAGEFDVEFSDLLEKMKLIKLVSSTFKSPRTDGIGFIKFLLRNLRELGEIDLIAHSKNQILIVHKEFVILEAFLEKIANHRNKHEKFTALWSRVIEVANSVMFIVNSFDLSPLSFSSVSDELLHVRTEFLEIGGTYNFEAQRVEKSSDYVSSQGIIPKLNHGIAVGFKDETEKIINQVRYGSKKLDIVSIVGMPGLGKTTLARRVYSDLSIIRDFHIRAWCSVTQVYRMKDLLLEILACIIKPEEVRKYSQKDEGYVAHKLRKSLLRCRYFIILDDVWDIDAWNVLKRSLPDDKKGSRILMTTRLFEVASQVQADSEPHCLRQFTDDESWDLLQKMIFHNELCPPELCTVGKKIAQNCGGLPLTVVIVAGILATTAQDGWKEFAERTITRTVSSTELATDVLELSYRHVPDHLKPCLLYVGAFPQGQEIPVEKLLRLWIAEGFVQTAEQQSVDEVAEKYMMDLVRRSLIMLVKRRRGCRVHDLIHEFCATKAKEENLFHLLHGYDELYTLSESIDTGRSCIYDEPEHKSWLFFPDIRCLMFSSHGDEDRRIPAACLYILQVYKFLRVLDLEELCLCGFPTKLLELVELRYLAIGGKFQIVPSSISNLSNLETFILGAHFIGVVLPKTIWNMTNLRHLCTRGAIGEFNIPKDEQESSSILYNLRTFSVLSFLLDPSMEKILSKFPNIRTLDCALYEPKGQVPPDWSRVVRMDFLSQLESLRFDFHAKCAIQFHFPLNLKRLVLQKFSWRMISTVEKLSNLEELTLAFDENDEGDVLDASEEEEEFSEEILKVSPGVRADGEARWDISEVEFPKLKILELSHLNIVGWTGSGDHFPGLQTLIFDWCDVLKEVPACLGCNSPLQTIEIRHCGPSIRRLAEEIKEEQQAMGNEDLQIL